MLQITKLLFIYSLIIKYSFNKSINTIGYILKKFESCPLILFIYLLTSYLFRYHKSTIT